MEPHDKLILEHLNAAINLLQEKQVQPARKGRNPEWFRDTGRLTDKGLEHLHLLFQNGRTSYSVAKEMQMSYRAVSLRHDEWRKKNPTAAPWMRQDGR